MSVCVASFLLTTECKFSTESIIQLNEFELWYLKFFMFFWGLFKPHNNIRIVSSVTADKLPSGTLRLRGRAAKERIFSMFLDRISFLGI